MAAPPEGRFPQGFLWGTSSAAHQVEGDNRNSDWWEFEQQPGHIANGDKSGLANDHYHRYREDFALLRQLDQNAHRLSIEWSRIEPSEGEFDARQIRHYRDVLSDLREQGIEPMVTLHHFTSPIWFARKGGWAARGSAHAFLPFVHRVVDQLGDLVGLWCTINEPGI
jgi:beta-glucosidase